MTKDMTTTNTAGHTATWHQGYADAAVDQLDETMAGNPDVAGDYLAGWRAQQADHPEPCVRRASTKDPARPANTQHYYGACPECGSIDGYLNHRRDHWFVCDQHMTRWCAGANLFSDWQDEDEAVWQANAEKLEGYREVEPMPMEEDSEEALLTVYDWILTLSESDAKAYLQTMTKHIPELADDLARHVRENSLKT